MEVGKTERDRGRVRGTQGLMEQTSEPGKMFLMKGRFRRFFLQKTGDAAAGGAPRMMALVASGSNRRACPRRRRRGRRSRR